MTIEVDNTARAGGVTTAILSWLSGTMAIAIDPAESRALVQIVVALIGGLSGIAGAAVAVLVKHWVDNRKKKD